MPWKLLLVLLTVCTSCLDAAGSFFPDPKFKGQANIVFEDIQNSIDQSGFKALNFARQLKTVVSTSDDETRAWSQLIYAYLLLENDSIAKAWSIVGDTNEFQFAEYGLDLNAFQSLVIGSANTYRSEYQDAEKHLRQGIELQPSIELEILLKQQLAENLRYQGKLEEAYVVALEALYVSESTGDSSRIVDTFFVLGLIDFVRGELLESKRDMSLFYSYYDRRDNRKKVADGLSILGLIDYQNKNFDESISKSLRSYEIRKKIGDRKGQGESLNNLALAHMGQSNWSQALRYLEDALLLKTSSNDLTQLTVILNNIGQCHKRLGNLEEAQKSFEQALQKGLKSGQLRDAIRSQKNLIQLYADASAFEKAYELQQKAIVLKDSLTQIENSQAIQDLKVRYETQRKESELTLLQKENVIVTNRWLTLALVLFFLLVLAILIYDNQKRKHRQQTELLEAEDELQKAELNIMTEVLEHNQQKLHLYTENLLKKNELVEQLESQLKTKASAKEEVSKEKSMSAEGQRSIRSVRILTDEDWEEFKELFDGVHRGLLDRLLDQYHDLTLAEQRLFLLMKLSMSTKQIANILGVSPDSVKKGRYRLKKKLEVEKGTTLQAFVDHFD